MNTEYMISGSSGGGGGGKGGGGGGGSTPQEARNSLFSSSYAKILDLISEGEIEGLVNGMKSVYLDNTPVQNLNDSYNFKGISIVTRAGTETQEYIPGSDAVQNEVSVGITVEKATPLVRTITDTSIDEARITITVPQLQQYNDQGDILGSSVSLEIEVQYNGGGFTTAISDTISGRTNQQYQRQYGINLSGAFPVDIRVKRVTDDSTSSKLLNAFAWSSYTEITYTKLSYPHSALVGLRVDAEQFSRIPTRSYRIRGRRIKIPSNATVNSTTGALSYSGVWNGTFGAAQWCSDPAWCLYDLLINSRFGFGDQINTSQLDKFSFYSASQYCGASVPNGFGGTEPRFSCNVNIQTADDAYRLINDFCSIFRAMPYWSAGALTISQDRPSDPVYLFTSANVSEDGFNYSSSSLKTRPTVAVVQYMDLTLRDVAYEMVEDLAAIRKYGIVKTEIKAFACTSRGQAHRVGQWLLFTNNYEPDVINFTASIEAGAIVRPGNIISVSDPVKAGGRRGGKIYSATTTEVTIDSPENIAQSANALLSVVLPTGAIETRSIASISGNTLTVVTPFSVAPSANSVWIHESSELKTTLWRVLTVNETDRAKYEIVALTYNASKYDYIERGLPLEDRQTSNLNVAPNAPTSLSLIEVIYTYQSRVRAKIIASWIGPAGVGKYLVKYRKDLGNWTTIERSNADFELLDITPGYFEFYVYSISSSGKISETSIYDDIQADGKTDPPSNVLGFNVAVDSRLGVVLGWNPVVDPDLSGYEIRKGTEWATGVFVVKTNSTSYTVGSLAQGSHSYLIKAIDTTGNYSSVAASANIVIQAAGTPSVSSTFVGASLSLQWPATSGTLGVVSYKVYRGATFATSALLTTLQATNYSVSVNWLGSQTFWVSSYVDGIEGTAGSVTATVVAPIAPTITSQATGGSVTLSWTDAAQTLPITTYEIRRGDTWSTATVIGTSSSRLLNLTISASGTYKHWIAGIDSAGNYGTAGSSEVTVTV